MPASEIITLTVFNALSSERGIEALEMLIKNNELSIHATTESGKNGLLFCAVMQINDEALFKRFVKFYQTYGGNINYFSPLLGTTAMDAHAPNKESPAGITLNSNKQIIKTEYSAQFGREIPAAMAIQARNTAKNIMPGYEQTTNAISAQAVKAFSFETVELTPVLNYLADPKVNASGSSATINLEELFPILYPAIGQLYAEENVLSTCFLISNQHILTARHSVNHQQFSLLSVLFVGKDGAEIRGLTSITESGANFGLDYIIFELADPIMSITPLRLTAENQSSSLLFMGYQYDHGLVFSSFINPNPGGLAIVGYQETSPSLSGSPYISLDKLVCGLHTRSSLEAKTGLYLARILAEHPASVVGMFIRNESIENIIPLEFSGTFAEYTGIIRELGEFDEGRLKFSVDKNAVVSYEGRHDNQSDAVPRRKIRKRLENLALTLMPSETLTQVQKDYLALKDDADLGQAGIHIAHNISFQSMCRGFVDVINTPLSAAEIASGKELAELKAFSDFAEEIASSDDETTPARRGGQVKKNVPQLVREIRAAQKNTGGHLDQKTCEALTAKVSQVTRALNRKSKNLMPGDGSANSSIQAHTDPHLVKTATGYRETAQSASLAAKAAICFGPSFFTVKRSQDGKMVQSSSVNCGGDFEKAYYKP